MQIYSAGYLKQLADCCIEHDVLLIIDEVAMGFGRTGKRFAFNHADIDPDMVCVGKALTAGYMPLSACIVKDKIYNTFDDVWKIYCVNNNVYFGSLTYIFCYDYTAIKPIGKAENKTNNFFLFNSQNNIYLGNLIEGLLKLEKDSFQIAKSGDFFISKYLTSFLPFKQYNCVVATYMNGLFLMHLILKKFFIGINLS